MNVAFRVDASPRIGTGHVMRCLALADGLKARGTNTRFLCRHLSDSLAAIIERKGHGLARLSGDSQPLPASDLPHAHWLETSQPQDATDTLQALSDSDWDWIVADHYALDLRWETMLRTATARMMVIDDVADRPHDCDILLDQNFYSDMPARYATRVPPGRRLLLGPRYALLREEFHVLHGRARARTGSVRRVLVFFGGVDPDNYTARAISALAALPDQDFAVDVVIGAHHPARSEIETLCASHGYACHVQIPNIAELMARADLAVGAGGSATWERCCVGLPTLTLCVADNQRQLIEDGARAGLLYAPMMERNAIFVLERHLAALLDNTAVRELISHNGIVAVDGRGTLRVMRAMGSNSIEIRRADEKDSAALMAWRNHPSVREASRNTEPIAPQDHERWLQSVLQDANRDLLIGSRDDREPVGVVRFDVVGGCAEVSIYLVPGRGNEGLGAELLDSAERWLSAHRPQVKRIHAHVLGENAPSHRLFGAGGYVRESTRYFKEVGRA